MTTRTIRNAFSKRQRVVAPLGGPSMAHQSFKDECDINVLMARYRKTGILPENINEQAGQYLDCTANDFQEAMCLVAGAASLFNELPSTLRDRFQNDPVQLLNFLDKEENRPEAVKLGLVREGIRESSASTPTTSQPIPPADNSGGKSGSGVSRPADPAVPTPPASGG